VTRPLERESLSFQKSSGELLILRSLRRALPVTRQKMEWEKVSGYSLSADLTKARA
jgi:hypothetical protein